jgi:hypothetical protein
MLMQVQLQGSRMLVNTAGHANSNANASMDTTRHARDVKPVGCKQNALLAVSHLVKAQRNMQPVVIASHLLFILLSLML